MYYAITDTRRIVHNDYFLFGFYHYMNNNCMWPTILLDYTTAEEIGQLLGGN